MSIQSEIDRLNSAKTAISNAIKSRGVDVPDGTSISDMADLITKIPTFFTYKATFAVDSWVAAETSISGTTVSYAQTATVTSVDGGPAISSNMFLTAPYTASTNSESTNRTLAQTLSIINTGIVTLSDGSIKIEVATKPSCDITVYWFGREISE